MRIIDNQHDYYDYLQSPTDSLVFDRRNSFLLTKEMVYDRFKYTRYLRDSLYRHILLQCGATYWVFLATITKENDYTLDLLATWKNFDKPRKLIQIDIITLRNMKYLITQWSYRRSSSGGWEACNLKDNYYPDKIDAKEIENAITHEEFHHEFNLSRYIIRRDAGISFVEDERTIPLLKACGIANIIDPLDVFCAIEEHLSLLKTEAEKTEPLGATNDDKIVMHGFDTKTSFRGGKK